MPEKKDKGTNEPLRKQRSGGGAKSKTAKAKAESRRMATVKKTQTSAAHANEVETALKKTRTKVPRLKVKKADLEPILSAEDIETQEYTPDEFTNLLNMYEGTLRDIKEGEVVNGTVLGVTRDDIIVDVGFKSEGIIPLAEFTEPINIKVGDKIQVYLEAIEDSDGQLVLSKQKADFMRVWDRIKDCHDAGETVKGRIVRRIKGGMVVDLFGVEAFLPGSQIALRQVPDFDALVMQAMDLKIIKLNKSRRNIVVSRRVVLEEEREKMRDTLLKEIEPGQDKTGIVKNITDFGVFIDLGGVDGLLHITDMSWGRINHPSEVVHLGQEIRVKVLDFDKNNNRISLGLKQLTPYPWENVEERYPIGGRVKGRVVSITDYGAFVELEKGIEGLIHISEMSWTQHIKHPSKILTPHTEIEAIVLSVDKENEKISLGLKQLEADPWLTLDLKYPVGTKVSGRVRNLTTFGAFVEIEDGIDGLVHISDMSWTRRIQHPSEIMKRGDLVDVVVQGIDKENRRISLGHKQVQSDPWPDLQMQYALNTETIGTIARLLDRGVIVNLPGDVEGFVPTYHLAKPDLTRPSDAFDEGDDIPLRVIEFDTHNRRIVLSANSYFTGKDPIELEKYLAKHPTKVAAPAGAGPAPSEMPETSEVPETAEVAMSAIDKNGEEQAGAFPESPDANSTSENS